MILNKEIIDWSRQNLISIFTKLRLTSTISNPVNTQTYTYVTYLLLPVIRELKTMFLHKKIKVKYNEGKIMTNVNKVNFIH